MYETNGDFGKTRINDIFVSDEDADSLFCYSRIFWHEVNDLYALARPLGANSYLILLTLDGNGGLEIEDTSYEIVRESVAIIPPHVRHRYFCKPGCSWTFYGIHIYGVPATKILGRLTKENGFFFIHKKPQILADILEHIIVESRLCHNTVTPSVSKLISDFVHSLFILKKSVPVEKARSLFEKAAEYIELNYAEDIDINELSTRFFTSTSHFIRTFKEHSGVTPYQYIENYRMLQARRLLSYSNMSIADIAKEVGYKSPSNFISYFKKHKGVTPSVYRKNIDKYEKSIENLLPLKTKNGTDGNTKYRMY